MKNISKVSFVIIGTIIGAGFASGKEIETFFAKYELQGLFGIIISCILTGVIIYKVFSILQEKQIFSYKEFLGAISKKTKINKIIETIIQLFLLISFYIMVAGFCAYFKQEFNIPTMISAATIAILCYITFCNNIEGVISINTFLIPILILFVLYIGTKNIKFMYIQSYSLNFSKSSFNWLLSSILYASYNSIVLIPILINLKNYINTKNKAKKVSIICSVILSLLGICIFCLLLKGNNHIENLELPIIQIIKSFGKYYSYIYGIVVVTAIFTSTISAGYGFLSNLKNQSKKYIILLCISSILISPIGFSKLVNILYPTFGVLGLLQIFYILK